MLNARDRRKAEAYNELVELVNAFGISRSVTLLNIHMTTVMRWMTGKSEPPESALIALRAALLGQLPGMQGRQWQGWGFGRDGRLYSASGQSWSAGDIMAQEYERALIKALQNKVRELEAKLAKATIGGISSANDGDLTVHVTQSKAT